MTAVVNRKGGVGKSTITVNVAATTAEVLGPTPDDKDDYVVAISSDPQGSSSWWSDRVGDDLPFSFAQVKRAQDLQVLDGMKRSRSIKHAFIDTPGWMDLPEEERQSAGDPFGTGSAADAMRHVLAAADDLIIPMFPEGLSYIPTQETMDEVVLPLGIPYVVVINNWDPRDGVADLQEAQEFVRANGWNLANTVIRRYKVHTRAALEGTVVTRYKKNRVAMEAREDFYKLAVEIGAGGKGRR
jgi:chromosome partitioning protein